MAKTDSLSDEQINEMLERFDQTDPKLQRRIIAELIQRASERDELAREVRSMRKAQQDYEHMEKRSIAALNHMIFWQERIDGILEEILRPPVATQETPAHAQS